MHPEDYEALSLPHVRGGVSSLVGRLELLQLSSPRAWGCFYLYEISEDGRIVFPTCVGVFPLAHIYDFSLLSLPHVRGGVSL